jgi:hypothetical protein
VYPQWSYYPRNLRAPLWVTQLAGVFAAVEPEVSTVTGLVA